ncbi:hypothetical protein BN1708_007070 [Verticillium longisporum]|uniref:Uncharacterized protein n=1 Tax=Verticillium longisporum TaxID=100787 RepID=A0A0G4MQD3_VERLO|nr:hypothetical protein BN1708_007070 [Verticillium longisporum]
MTFGLPNVHGRVRISDCCSVDFDLHNAVDGLEEIELRAKSIGTTRRGIGPACSPRTTVITICEKFDGELFERKLRTPAASALEEHAYDYSQGLLRPAKEARNFILFIEKFLSVNDKGPKIRRVGTGPAKEAMTDCYT